MRFLKNALVAATALVFCAAPAFAANNYTVKDSTGATITICAQDQGSGVEATCHYGVASENHLGEIGGHSFVVSATFTSTATTTALSDGDLYANSGTAGSVVPLDFSTVCRVNQGTFHVWRARIWAADTGLAGKSFFLKLYKDSPTVTNGDNGAWLSTHSNYLGQISITLGEHFSDPFEAGNGAPTVGNAITGACASSSQHIYGLLVSNGGSATLQGSKGVNVAVEGDDN